MVLKWPSTIKMEFSVSETPDRRRLSLNVMLSCRTLLPGVNGEDEQLICFDHGKPDSRTCNRVACRRGTSSYKTSTDAREEDMCLRALSFKAFLDGVTLTQLKLTFDKGDLPGSLVPELLSWAIHLDKSPRVLVAILKQWPFKQFVLRNIFPLAFEGRRAWGANRRSRFCLNGYNTIAFGAVSVSYAWRYDRAVSAVISAITTLQEDVISFKKDFKIESFDLTGVPLSDADFSALAKLTSIPSSALYKFQRKIMNNWHFF